jgi:hypothetical protein
MSVRSKFVVENAAPLGVKFGIMRNINLGAAWRVHVRDRQVLRWCCRFSGSKARVFPAEALLQPYYNKITWLLPATYGLHSILKRECLRLGLLFWYWVIGQLWLSIASLLNKVVCSCILLLEQGSWVGWCKTHWLGKKRVYRISVDHKVRCYRDFSNIFFLRTIVPFLFLLRQRYLLVFFQSAHQ